MGPADLVVAFDRSTAAAWQVRHRFRSVLDAADQLRDDVLLVVSELVSNVVLHTGGGGVVRLWSVPGGGFRVEVEDFDAQRPTALPDVDPPRASGRGLLIVGRLAACSGTSATSTGKVMWVEFDPADGRSVEPLEGPSSHRRR